MKTLTRNFRRDHGPLAVAWLMHNQVAFTVTPLEDATWDIATAEADFHIIEEKPEILDRWTYRS